jgi:hypothetical protein
LTRTGFVITHIVSTLSLTMEVNLSCTLKPLCDLYGLEFKPTSIMNPQVNAILEHMHQMIMEMLHTAEIDMAITVSESDITVFLTNAAWDVCSTYHILLKAPYIVNKS